MRVMFFDTWSRRKHFNRILVEMNLGKTSLTTLQCSFLGLVHPSNFDIGLTIYSLQMCVLLFLQMVDLTH